MRYLILMMFLFGDLNPTHSDELSWVRVSDDQQSFVFETNGERFVPWGVNYDRDDAGRLMEDYWNEDWPIVVADFHEIKALGANCIRIHLQFGKFMDSPEKPNGAALKQLSKLIKLAEKTGLYLNITGLGCYHKANVPAWYDALDERQRWTAQAVFWQSVARAGRNSPAVFCYDLMNEPVVGGAKIDGDWLVGEPLGGKYFVQRISLDTGDRTRESVARDWVNQLTATIRQEDARHLITVGVIPWAHVWPNAKPVFYSEAVAKHLDFVSVHFYPKSGELEKAVAALRVYDIGKPVIIEEMFPLKCSIAEMLEFVRRSADIADGWISFYWGKPANEYDQQTIAGKITAEWLKEFQKASRSPHR